jgi:ferritin-like metal-binding protein YciE
MKLKTLEDLFVDEMKDLYSAEEQIVEALPKMVKAASSQELKKAFQEHLEVSKTHLERVEQILDELNEKPSGKKCKGMEGLLKEGEEIIKEDSDADVKDAALIAAAQRVEHYEMAGYGSARTHAMQLDFDEAADILQQTLDEEGEADQKLTDLATAGINAKADK